MRYTEAVGKRLGTLLKKRGLTQKEFSQKSHVSRVTINRIIHGRVDVVTFETLLIFCKTLDMTLGDFFDSELFHKDIEMGGKKRGRYVQS